MALNQEIKLTSLRLNLDDNISRYYARVAALWAVAVLFFIGASVLFFQAMNTYELVQIRKQDFSDVQTELSYVTTAQTVAEQNVLAYNSLLTRLVPATEDYFSLVASLERLSLRTGIDIARYTIDLPEEGSEVYPLSIVATVPKEDFERFLDTYKYGTGRLVTISTMSYSDTNNSNVRFTMNFYSKDVTTRNISRIASLSMNDIEILQDIVRQIQQSESMANGGQGVPPEQSIVPPDLQN